MRNLTASELSAADNPLAASPLGGPALPAASASGGTTIGGPVDPVELFLGHAVSPTRTTAADVPATEEGVRTLADAGAWKAAGALAKQLLDRSHPVDVLLRLRWYRIVALLKLRDVAEATREMAVLGDLNGGSYRYERYETVYPGRSGSMVPFSLRLLHAHMPALGGDAPPSLQRLYTLLGETDAELGALAISAPAAHRAELVHRRRQLCLALVNVFVSQKEHALAVAQARAILAQLCAQLWRNSLTARPTATARPAARGDAEGAKTEGGGGRGAGDGACGASVGVETPLDARAAPAPGGQRRRRRGRLCTARVPDRRRR